MRNLIKKILTESDDFDWIRDIQATFTPETPPKPGDVLICLPGFFGGGGGDIYDPSYGGYGYAEGRIIVVSYVDLNPDGPTGKNLVIWPDEDKSKQYWDRNTTCFTCGIYSGALTYYNNSTDNIIKESDDWDWIRDIEVETDLTPAELKMRYDTIPFGIFSKYIAGQFGDIYLEGDKLFLYLKDWSEFADLFRDDRGGYGGYINRYLAKSVLAEDDYWEPYYDFVEFLNQVWSMVTDDEELLQYIKEYIKKNNFIGQELESEMDPDEGGFREDMLLDNDLLGELINDEPMFEDLKLNLKWAYESAYNTAARDNIYLSTVGSIRDIFGDGEWTSFENSRGHTENMLKFDVTNLVIESVENSIDNCLEGCRKYFDVSKHYDVDEHGTEVEAFEEFCAECVDHPFDYFGSFIGLYSDLLDNSNDLLNPRYDEYPDDSDVVKYFSDDVYSRI